MVTLNSNVLSLDLCVLSFKLKTIAELNVPAVRNVQDKVCEKKSISSCVLSLNICVVSLSFC